MSHIWEIRNYASFHGKSSLPPVIIHVRPIHTKSVLSANMVLVIEKYYLLEIEDRKFSAPTIPQKEV